MTEILPCLRPPRSSFDMRRENRPEELDRVPAPDDRLRSARRFLAGAITTAVIGLFLWSGLRGGVPGPSHPGMIAPGPAPAPESPSPFAAAEARLRDLLDRGRRGDVPGYLAAFNGSLRDRLEREARERGPDGFAEDLRRAPPPARATPSLPRSPTAPTAAGS